MLQAMVDTSNMDQVEEAMAGTLERIESLIRQDDVALSNAWRKRKRELDEREEAVAAREADVLQRERAVAEREGALSRSGQKAKCPHCNVNFCTRAGPCFNENGQDLHPHSCLECHQAYRRSQAQGGKGSRGGDR